MSEDPKDPGIPVGSINEPATARTMPEPLSINEPGAGAAPGEAPVIDELMPDAAAIGDPSFTLDIVGTGFNATSVIVFAGHDEPTTWNEEDGTVSTGVNMDVWLGPDTVQVAVRNGTALSNTLDFTFAEAVEGDDELPSAAELGKMTRHDLDGLAMNRGVDITEASNKDDVTRLLLKDARKSKRKRVK